MDIVTHAIVGAAIGSSFGHPIIGGISAIVPDIVLGIKRRHKPTNIYDFTHSFLGLFAMSIPFYFLNDQSIFLAVFFGVLSHIGLDVITHGKQWAPPLLFPAFSRFTLADEWEFGNRPWCFGLLASIGIILCVLPL